MRKIFPSLALFSSLLISSYAHAASSLEITILKPGMLALNLSDYNPITEPSWSSGGLPGTINSSFKSNVTGPFGSTSFSFTADYAVMESGASIPLSTLKITMSNKLCDLTGDTSFPSPANPNVTYLAAVAFNGRGEEGDCIITISEKEISASTLDLAVTTSIGSQANLSSGTITENNNAQFTPGLPSDVATNGAASTQVIGINPPETFSFKASYKLMEGANLVSDNISFTMSENGCSLLTPSRIDYQQQYTYEISATDNCKLTVNAVAYGGGTPVTEAMVTIRNQISTAK